MKKNNDNKHSVVEVSVKALSHPSTTGAKTVQCVETPLHAPVTQSGRPKRTAAISKETAYKPEESSDEDSDDLASKTSGSRKRAKNAKAEPRNHTIDMSSELRIARLEKELDTEKKKAQQEREDFLKKIKSTPVTMCDDTQIRSKISKLSDKCKRWASKHALPDTAGKVYTATERSSILDLLQHRYKAVSTYGETKIFDGLTNCAGVLLNSAVTHLIWFEILNRPFYFLKQAHAVGGPLGSEATLDWLIDFGESAGKLAEKNTYHWVATLVRTLNPTSETSCESAQEEKAILKNKTMKSAVFAALKNLLKRHCAALLRPASVQEAKARDDLFRKICNLADDVSYTLWTQGYAVECFGGKELPKQFMDKCEYLRAHPTMLIEKGDASRDGEDIFLITTPIVEAYGNERGEFHSAVRIFDPATVCMAPREHLEKVALAWRETQKEQGDPFIGGNAVATNNSTTDRTGSGKISQSPVAGACGAKRKQQVPAAFPTSQAVPSLKFNTTSIGRANAAPASQGPHPKRTEQNDRAFDHRNQYFGAMENDVYEYELQVVRRSLRTGDEQILSRHRDILPPKGDGQKPTSPIADDGEDLPAKRQRTGNKSEAAVGERDRVVIKIEE